MIEVEAHNLVRRLVQSSAGDIDWPHYLTMTRLVARALRLGRSALIQTGVRPRIREHPYRFSYLIPVLVWGKASVIVASEAVIEQLLAVEIPQIKGITDADDQKLPLMPIQKGDRWPSRDFQGLLLTTPQIWLADRLSDNQHFPPHIPTIIDDADNLEQWSRDRLTAALEWSEWTLLTQKRPEWRDILQLTQVRLIRSIFAHPANLYGCHLLNEEEQDILQNLFLTLTQPTESTTTSTETSVLSSGEGLNSRWHQFYHQWLSENQLKWVEVDRAQGSLKLYCSPLEVASALSPIWEQQPVVLIGGTLDLDKNAPIYRQSIGLGDLTCVKFTPARQSQLIQLYLPSGIPMPNTPQFEKALIEQLRTLLCMSINISGLKVLLVEDIPLKGKVAAVLASEFGSLVQVETTAISETGVLVTGWQFWRNHQHQFVSPHLLAIATLPLPSLENPLVAGRVAYYKQQRQDWFRLYLLPAALTELQGAVAPVRQKQGIVALLDSRVTRRTYGKQVLTALSPHVQIDYLDTTWLNI